MPLPDRPHFDPETECAEHGCVCSLVPNDEGDLFCINCNAVLYITWDKFKRLTEKQP